MARYIRNPLQAPWPPGVDVRIIQERSTGRRVLQLREGAALPAHWYIECIGRRMTRRTHRSLN